MPKKKKAAAAAKPTTNPSTIEASSSLFDDEFRTNKKDKRQIKHSSFVSKIEKSRKRPLKRRRPNKKLVANLDSLVDALPDAEDGDGNSAADSQVNIIKHKSLKHKPGALKRKEKLDRVERDRFAKNMAQMSAGPVHNPSVSAEVQDASGEQPVISGRWAALRNFISQTMDQNPEFKSSKPS